MSSTGQPQNEAAPSREPVPSASGGAGAEASGSAVVGSESPPQQVIPTLVKCKARLYPNLALANSMLSRCTIDVRATMLP